MRDFPIDHQVDNEYLSKQIVVEVEQFMCIILMKIDINDNHK